MTTKTIDIRLSIDVPPAIPEGWTPVCVEACKRVPYFRSRDWPVANYTDIGFDDLLRLVLEHAALSYGLENTQIDIVLEKAGDEGRLIYDGERDRWTVDVTEPEPAHAA